MAQQEYETPLYEEEQFVEDAEQVVEEETGDQFPTMYPVESSNVKEFGYDDDNQILYVRFLAKGNRPESLYGYYNVEPEVFDQFFAAPSKGQFIWTNLRDRYEYERLE